MRLLIRGQDINSFTVGISDKESVVQQKKWDVRPDAYLRSIFTSLEEWRLGYRDLSSIAVVKGKGSFTALRGSVTLANTLAFSLNIPLASVVTAQDRDDKEVMERLRRARKGKVSWTVPAYGQPPRITKAKKMKMGPL